MLDYKENSSGRGAQAGPFSLKTKKPALGGLYIGKSSLSGSLRFLVHPVGPSQRSQIIEPHPILPDYPMSPLGGHLPYVEGVADHKRRFLRLAGAFTVGAARPAAGAAFAGGEIFLGTGNAPPASVSFLGVFYPADPFVARQWGDFFPLGEHGWIGLQGLP